jgi:hypothetical protein
MMYNTMNITMKYLYNSYLSEGNIIHLLTCMRVIAIYCSPRHQLLSERKPTTIVGVDRHNKLDLVPEYPVDKCYVIPNSIRDRYRTCSPYSLLSFAGFGIFV